MAFHWEYFQCKANIFERTYLKYKANICTTLAFSPKYFQCNRIFSQCKANNGISCINVTLIFKIYGANIC